jgi:uncharacterized integral membrane protein (TIGR00698 family)
MKFSLQPLAGLRSVPGMAMTIAPGLALSAAVATVANAATPMIGRVLPVPAMVIALVAGIALNPVAARPAALPGMTFCLKVVLRWTVALLGLRVALADIVGLGASNAVGVIAAMLVTIAAGFWLARLCDLPAGFGALVGAATAVCGASATLATSTVVPEYPGKQADVAFVVVGVNALATLAMVIYPPACALLGFDPRTSGVMLGGTIHDVAQVVGAGYAVSETAGNTAVIVKLFRVFLLLPVVFGIGWHFTRQGVRHGKARMPVPVFALVFLALCVVNSAAPHWPTLAVLYAPVRGVLIDVSTWGLLIAIAALGLGTSVSAVGALDWRHVAVMLGTSLTIVAVMTVGLLAFRL